MQIHKFVEPDGAGLGGQVSVTECLKHSLVYFTALGGSIRYLNGEEDNSIYVIFVSPVMDMIHRVLHS